MRFVKFREKIVHHPQNERLLHCENNYCYRSGRKEDKVYFVDYGIIGLRVKSVKIDENLWERPVNNIIRIKK